MGFSIGGGIGPGRYSKSLGGGRKGSSGDSGPIAITTDGYTTVYAWVIGCIALAVVLVMISGWLLIIPIYLLFKLNRVAWWADKRSLSMPELGYQEWKDILKEADRP